MGSALLTPLHHRRDGRITGWRAGTRLAATEAGLAEVSGTCVDIVKLAGFRIAGATQLGWKVRGSES
jgi:hypothetical protein